MSAIIKYPEEIKKCMDIYEPYSIQIYQGKLEGVPQEAIDAYNKVKKWAWEQGQQKDTYEIKKEK